MPIFTREAAAAHIRKHHPGCPEFAVQFFADEVASKRWKRATIGKAVGIAMQNYLRHNMTRYETLLLEGIDRKEARRLVQPRINAILAVWRQPPKSAPQPPRERLSDSVDEAPSASPQ